jgi:phenylalanyl-tRNA synthetase beta chain
MIVSWNWLQDYVKPQAAPADVAERLTMSGMNLESIEERGGDFAIDLEITSNRADCLGHLGIAREIGVVCETPFHDPDPRPKETTEPASQSTSVEIQCPELCPTYSARVIRGVTIRESPQWLRERLEAVGITPVNNVVDATNYVLMECGQPLHAFDLDRLEGKRIIVRRATAGEALEAIDHRSYKLTPEMCVIADARKPVAIAGVMGGAPTEVHSGTKTLLIESAVFAPSTVRATARSLNLHSPSSYRFERGLDPARVEWASRRCCELILQTAGGELLAGAVTVGAMKSDATNVTLRFARIRQVVGIEIPEATCLTILDSLGLKRTGHRAGMDATYSVPSWRRDLTREIDLIEEVARVHGYQHIPEDVMLPTAGVSIRKTDVVRSRAEHVLTAAGLFESLTFSFLPDSAMELFVPPGLEAPLSVSPQAGEYGSKLRQSLLPSLLLVRRENERQGVLNANVFEIARVYRNATASDESQPIRLGILAGGGFRTVKGLLEAIVHAVNPAMTLDARPFDHPAFQAGRSAELLLNGTPWGWLGEMNRNSFEPLRDLKLREEVTGAEVDWNALLNIATTDRRQTPLPEYPAIARDFNFVIDQSVTWTELANVVRKAAGPYLEAVVFMDSYSGQQIPAGKKSYVLSLTYRAADRTLTSGDVDAAQNAVSAAVTTQLGGVQR